MDNGNPTRKDNGSQLSSTQVQLVITWDQVTGAINVQGPINNSVLCYGILEASKDVIKKYIETNQSPILRPGAGMIAS